MSDTTELVREALSHPLAGGAVLSWVLSMAIGAYWVKRLDDERPTSSVTKTAAFISLIIALGLTGAFYFKKNSIIPIEHKLSPGHGHIELGIPDKVWNCSTFDEILLRYLIPRNGVEIVRERAKSGDGDYVFLSAMTYDAGLMDLQVDPEQKQKLLQDATFKGNPRAMLGLSSYFFDIGNAVDGKKWLLEAQKQGLGIAFLRSAEMYQGEKASGVEADAKGVIESLEGAIRQGCVGQATYFLGNLYYFGHLGNAVTKKDNEQGLGLLKRSIQYQSEYRLRALNLIMQHYIYAKDLETASLYIDGFIKSCDQGYCLYTIGTYYDDKKDYSSAIKWYNKAIRSGLIDSKKEKEVKLRLSQLGR